MVQSIDRAMQIIHLFIENPKKDNWPISQIADEVGLPLSTTHRLISSLVKYELVAQVELTKNYMLGPKWMEIGLKQLESMDLRMIARPILERLTKEVKETSFLSIPNHYYSLGIDRVDSPHKVRVVEELGERIPMPIGAPNKVMLAFMEEKKAIEIVTELVKEEKKRDNILSQLPLIREMGYAASYAEMTEGTASFAAPILGFGGELVGALSIGTITYETTEERAVYLLEKVKEYAQLLSNAVRGV
ncbi:IclR family transcriptional regulator [Niallia sp. FSL W8-0635]|uniref:IclR family transcriptional regulator n=1 Tax=Niallia sp. FSL W8-0635 TaxID=2975337 RepID=UPI0009D234AC|nr:transcriptional regulator [Mycobacteroides abscessus subsp. abscessus]